MEKVCVYAISKNEEQFVDRWMDNVGSADEVVVLDTGSTDKTVEKLQKRGARVINALVEPWRFDAARNLSIQYAPSCCNILFCIDIDETIAEKDWKGRLLDAWRPGCNRGRYNYVWDHRPDGSNGRSFKYEKIHTHDYEWYLPCHEFLRRSAWAPSVEDHWAEIDITVHHYPDGTKSRSNYINLLQLATEEHPGNDRMAHYYGRELYFQFRYEEAIIELKRHLSLPAAVWEDERCASMIIIAQCYDKLKNEAEAERWFFRACGEAPHLREPFIEAAKMYSMKNKFTEGYAMAKRALRVGCNTGSYIVTPYAWNEGPWDQIATCAYYIGLKSESLAAAKKACQLAPWDGRLKSNFEIIERMSPELSANAATPHIVYHEPWIDNPKFGLLLPTYQAAPYIHTALQVRRNLYPEVPCLVIDDCSPQQDTLKKLCEEYDAHFFCNSQNMNHTKGDLLAIANGLRWAHNHGIDILVKMSRRFIPKQDWRPSLSSIIKKTAHATYTGINDATWGLRTECVAFHVARWVLQADDIAKAALKANWLWVEKFIQDIAVKILPWGTNNAGAAFWEFPGLGKYVMEENHLWHDTADPKHYQEFAASLGLNYSVNDFLV